MEENAIYINADFSNWRWFHRPKILSVFLWLLLNANTITKYHGKDKITRGSVVATNELIAEDCGLTISNVRTALANLQETGEIKREQRNRYQIITVINFETYKSF